MRKFVLVTLAALFAFVAPVAYAAGDVLQEKIQELVKEKKQNDAKAAAITAEQKAACDSELNRHSSYLFDQCVAQHEYKKVVATFATPATMEHYKEWLRGYIHAGGAVELRVAQFTFRHWFVAEKDFSLRKIKFSLNISIIVPKGIQFLGFEDDGDISLMPGVDIYLMDGFQKKQGGEAIIYSDMVPESVTSVK